MTVWPLVPLGEVLLPTTRPEPVVATEQYRLLGAHWYAEGLYIKDIKAGSEIQANQLYRVEAGDFVYNRLFAWKGSFALAGKDVHGCFVSNEFPCFRLREGRGDGRYLHYYFSRESAWNEALGLSSGGTPTSRNRLKEEHLLAMSIPLPPIEEQRRIVGWIGRASPQIAALRAQQNRLLAEIESLAKRVLSETILATGGQERPLHEVCDAIIDNLHSNPIYAESGVPCVRSPDVGWGTLMLETALRTDEAEYTRRTVRGEPKADDIVLVREGGGTGKAALVAPGQRFSLGQRVMMLRPDKTKIVPEFFLYQLLSPLVQEEQIGPVTKGSASPHLNIGALQQFRLVVPCLSTQERAVQDLRQIRGKIAEVRSLHGAALRQVEALLPSILNQAFNGEL